jgi:peptidyl-tRNA hydrolase
VRDSASVAANDPGAGDQDPVHPDAGDTDPGDPDAGAEALGPDGPWALQLVARVEHDRAPGIADLTTAAATAVVRMLADPRSGPDGPWGEAVSHWEAGAIRKLVRRARGAAWERALALDGLTVSHGTASVHAVPPAPARPLPPELDRLQVSGLHAGGPRPTGWRSRPDWPGVRIALTPDGDLTAGKLAAQAGHAAHLAWRTMDARRRDGWARAGLVVEVAFPDAQAWTALVPTGGVAVHDAGFTEAAPGQLTALAWW